MYIIKQYYKLYDMDNNTCRQPSFWLHKFTQKQFSHYLLTSMLTESQVKFCSQQNISGVSQQNIIVVFSGTTGVDGGQLKEKENGSMQLNNIIISINKSLSVVFYVVKQVPIDVCCSGECCS